MVRLKHGKDFGSLGIVCIDPKFHEGGTKGNQTMESFSVNIVDLCIGISCDQKLGLLG